MPDTRKAERLLSLFTAPDNAAAIAGDLTEESQHRSPAWFWLQVWGTTFALLRATLSEAPGSALLLMLLACMLIAVAASGGAAADFLFVWSAMPVRFIALATMWWGGALCAGASLVGLAPRRGMAVCAVVAAAIAAVLIAFGLQALWREAVSAADITFYVISLAGMALLPIGGLMTRRRRVRRDTAVGRQQ